MNPTLTALEHLSYVINSALIGLDGETKTELHNLVINLRENKRYRIEDHSKLADRLEEALELYRDNQNFREGRSAGLSALTRESRHLWFKVEQITNNTVCAIIGEKNG